MSFSSPDTFTPDLDNPNSQAYIIRAESVKTALEFYLKKLPNFLKLIVLRFRSGSVITDTQVVFDTNGTLPNPANITSAVRDAASNASLGLNITAGSINVSTAVIPTQASPDTTTPSVSAASTQASNLSNSSSDQFKARSNNITSQLQPFFMKAFTNFIRMFIWRFRSGSIVVDSTLEFSSSASIPNGTQLNSTLLEFYLKKLPNFLQLIVLRFRSGSVITDTQVVFDTNGTLPDPANITSAVRDAASNASLGLNITADSINVSTADLSNSSSDQFKARSNNITSQLQPFFMKAFKNFIRMFIWRFRSGSILVDSALEFSSSASIPNVTQVTSTLVDAIKNGNLTFTVDPNSIIINQTLGNSTGSSMAPRMVGSLPLLSMSLISLLLSVPLHF
ncbi:hypothetical protein MHYP_G00243930 [Metynnis hypsauchen]